MSVRVYVCMRTRVLRLYGVAPSQETTQAACDMQSTVITVNIILL